MRYCSILLFLLVLSSCADLQQSEYLQEIEAIETKIEHELTRVNELSASVDSNLIQNGDSLILELKQFESDTINLDEAKLMNAFQRLQESIPVVIALKKQLTEAVESQKKDLKKLKSDIKKGAGRRGKYADYVAKEKEKSEKLSKQFERLTALLERVNNEIKPITEDIIRLIHERNALKEVQ